MSKKQPHKIIEKSKEAFFKYRSIHRLSNEEKLYSAKVTFECQSDVPNYDGLAQVSHNMKGTYGSNFISVIYEEDLYPIEYSVDYQIMSFDTIFIITGFKQPFRNYKITIYPI